MHLQVVYIFIVKSVEGTSMIFVNVIGSLQFGIISDNISKSTKTIDV